MMLPIEYLIIGHLSYDITSNRIQVGGTVSYACVTALAFKKTVGVVTSYGKEPELDIGQLEKIPLHFQQSPKSTTFQNIQTTKGRRQICFHRANPLKVSDVPHEWENSTIIHLAPIVNEIPPQMTTAYSPKLLGITPQGWFRCWDNDGIVYPIDWQEFLRSKYYTHLSYADAVVISDEDVGFDQSKIDDLANQCSLLIVTQGPKGATVYWQRKTYHYDAPKVSEVDPVGAGDVFASTFFIQLYETQDVHRSTQIAVKIAAYSVTRMGQLKAPTQEEIYYILKE